MSVSEAFCFVLFRLYRNGNQALDLFALPSFTDKYITEIEVRSTESIPHVLVKCCWLENNIDFNVYIKAPVVG